MKLSERKHKKVSAPSVFHFRGKFRLISIRNKLLASFAITIIPIILLGMISYNRSFNSIKDSNTASYLETMAQLDKYLNLSLGNLEALSTQLFVNRDFQDYINSGSTGTSSQTSASKNNLYSFAAMMVMTNPVINNITIILDKNMSVATSGITVKENGYENISNGSLAAMAREFKGNSFWVGNHPDVDAQRSGAMTENAISVVRLIKNTIQGEERGLLVMDIKPSLISDALADINLGNGSELHLISPDGKDFAFRIANGASQQLDMTDKNNQKPRDVI